MKRFLIKFCTLFAIIYGFIGTYAFIIKPNLSGDMGNMGDIPFGSEYRDSIRGIYNNHNNLITNIVWLDNQADSTVITMGDSFSQPGRFGYSQFVAEGLHCRVYNIAEADFRLGHPEQSFIQLVNHNQIPTGTIVIVESVERSMILRLSGLDFADTTTFVAPQKPAKEDIGLLDRTISWMKKSVGIKQTIHRYKTTKELFTHKENSQKIYIYDSPWNGDGDFKFTRLSQEDYDKACDKAWENLYQLKELADKHQIRLIYLVAADKYDVYEPFIINAPIHNPTLDNIPNEDWIVNSKTLLQNAAYLGVKDLYYINDTHWSPIGAEIVGKEVADRIKHLYPENKF